MKLCIWEYMAITTLHYVWIVFIIVFLLWLGYGAHNFHFEHINLDLISLCVDNRRLNIKYHQNNETDEFPFICYITYTYHWKQRVFGIAWYAIWDGCAHSIDFAFDKHAHVLQVFYFFSCSNTDMKDIHWCQKHINNYTIASETHET